MSDYIFEGFTAYHLAWLQSNDLLGGGVRELGALVDIPEVSETLETYLRDGEGVIDSEGKLTPAGAELFDPLTSYTDAYWGVATIDSYRQPVKVEMDEELIDAGLDLGIVDTPRVFFKVTISHGYVTTAVRAGDGVTINRSPLASRSAEEAAAGEVFSILDPEGSWHGTDVPMLSTSLETARTAGGFIGSSGVDDRDMAREMSETGADRKVVDDMIRLVKKPTAAMVTIVRSTNDSNVTSNPISVRFFTDGSAVINSPRTSIDRITRSVFAPWSKGSLADAFKDLKALPVRVRIEYA